MPAWRVTEGSPVRSRSWCRCVRSAARRRASPTSSTRRSEPSWRPVSSVTSWRRVAGGRGPALALPGALPALTPASLGRVEAAALDLLGAARTGTGDGQGRAALVVTDGAGEGTNAPPLRPPRPTRGAPAPRPRPARDPRRGAVLRPRSAGRPGALAPATRRLPRPARPPRTGHRGGNGGDRPRDPHREGPRRRGGGRLGV